MWTYRLRLNSGEDFYYDSLDEARFDKMEFGGAIFDRTGKEVF
jgi:hypothetical protein